MIEIIIISHNKIHRPTNLNVVKKHSSINKQLFFAGPLLVSTHYSVLCKHGEGQDYNARKVNCSSVYSAYILKPVLTGRICKQEKMHN